MIAFAAANLRGGATARLRGLLMTFWYLTQAFASNTPADLAGAVLHGIDESVAMRVSFAAWPE